jgi:hypothetical protein
MSGVTNEANDMRDEEKEPKRKPVPSQTVFSNAVRLTGREWLIVAACGVLIVVLLPSLWKNIEPLTLEPDYRIPHDLSNDYWLYERYADLASQHFDTLLIGDSVIWGEYVRREGTLSHYLNELSGQQRHANLGLDGAHPLALAGLIEYYARKVSGKHVVLHCNPLWMSSPRADLRERQAGDFNHPRLVPQFVPAVPAYKEEISPRIGAVVERYLPVGSWSNHLQQVYYDRNDIPSWTLENPYENPLKPVMEGLPATDDSLRHLPQPWYKSGITPQDYPWIDLGSSFQWPAFRRAVEILEKRGNRLFVLVGPFNEHLLTPNSKNAYREVKKAITDWLETRGIAHAAPPALPSELYGDASHPLAEGYARLARELLKEPSFRAPHQ